MLLLTKSRCSTIINTVYILLSYVLIAHSMRFTHRPSFHFDIADAFNPRAMLENIFPIVKAVYDLEQY